MSKNIDIVLVVLLITLLFSLISCTSERQVVNRTPIPPNSITSQASAKGGSKGEAVEKAKARAIRGLAESLYVEVSSEMHLEEIARNTEITTNFKEEVITKSRVNLMNVRCTILKVEEIKSGYEATVEASIKKELAHDIIKGLTVLLVSNTLLEKKNPYRAEKFLKETNASTLVKRIPPHLANDLSKTLASVSNEIKKIDRKIMLIKDYMKEDKYISAFRTYREVKDTDHPDVNEMYKEIMSHLSNLSLEVEVPDEVLIGKTYFANLKVVNAGDETVSVEVKAPVEIEMKRDIDVLREVKIPFVVHDAEPDQRICFEIPDLEVKKEVKIKARYFPSSSNDIEHDVRINGVKGDVFVEKLNEWFPVELMGGPGEYVYILECGAEAEVTSRYRLDEEGMNRVEFSFDAVTNGYTTIAFVFTKGPIRLAVGEHYELDEVRKIVKNCVIIEKQFECEK